MAHSGKKDSLMHLPEKCSKNHDPPFFPVGTEVSASYKGAFCSSKVTSLERKITCKVRILTGPFAGRVYSIEEDNISGEFVRGEVIRVNANVDTYYAIDAEALVLSVQDQSQYTVVFDDGDVIKLGRSKIFPKSGSHYGDSVSLNITPLISPRQFAGVVRSSSAATQRTARVSGATAGTSSSTVARSSSLAEVEDEPTPGTSQQIRLELEASKTLQREKGLEEQKGKPNNDDNNATGAATNGGEGSSNDLAKSSLQKGAKRGRKAGTKNKRLNPVTGVEKQTANVAKSGRGATSRVQDGAETSRILTRQVTLQRDTEAAQVKDQVTRLNEIVNAKGYGIPDLASPPVGQRHNFIPDLTGITDSEDRMSILETAINGLAAKYFKILEEKAKLEAENGR